jgi:hypothetical protein
MGIKIFSIESDVNKYQWLMPELPEDDWLEFLNFDCSDKNPNWSEIKWRSFNPLKKAGNFYHIGSGSLVFDEEVYDSEMFTLFEMAGQILPMKLNEKKLYALNVLECINSLDQENSEWDYYDDGTRGRVLKYRFLKNWFSESSIFKIPETHRTDILTYSGLKNADDEFYSLYKSLNFTGLVFKELFEFV